MQCSWDSIPHVGRRLDGWNEFERNVGKANEANNAGGNPVPELLANQNAADEEVDCVANMLAMFVPSTITTARCIVTILLPSLSLPLLFLVVAIGNRCTYRYRGR